MCAAHAEHAFVCVDLVAEVDIVHFLGVTLVHVSLQKKCKHVFGGIDTKLSKNAEELTLAHVAAVGDIEVLELRLQVDTSVLDGGPVLVDVGLHLFFFLVGSFKILASCSLSIILGNGLDCNDWVLVNAFLGEGRVDGGAKVCVVEHGVSSILLGEGVKLSFGEGEVKH